MLRHILVLALLAAPGPALARPAKTPPKAAKVAAVPAPTPVCTHVRRKSFSRTEGWSVRTVSFACRTVTATVSHPGGKSFTSLKAHQDGRAK